jgi:hypothetical protein
MIPSISRTILQQFADLGIPNATFHCHLNFVDPVNLQSKFSVQISGVVWQVE